MASLVKAFRRTVEEGRFSVVIVDAPHLLADDLKAYWASGQVRLASSSCGAALPCTVVVQSRLCVEGFLLGWLHGPLLAGLFTEYHLLLARNTA